MLKVNEIVYFLSSNKKTVYKGIISRLKNTNGFYTVQYSSIIESFVAERKEEELYNTFFKANSRRIKDFKVGDKVIYCLGNKMVYCGEIKEKYNLDSWVIENPDDKYQYKVIASEEFIFKSWEEAETCYEECKKRSYKCPRCEEYLQYHQDRDYKNYMKDEWFCENCKETFTNLYVEDD